MILPLPIKLNILKSELLDWDQENKRVEAVFHQLFPVSLTDEKTADDVIMFTKAYNKYKKRYMKHLAINPENKNLSKFSCT